MQEKEQQEQFYKLYRKDCGRGLNPKKLVIISLVRSYEDVNKPFFMSNEYISKEIGLCKRTVQKTINELVGSGELFKKEVRDNTRGQANCIRILSTKPLEASAENAHGNTEPSADFAQNRVQILQEARAENAPYNNSYNKNYYKKSENTKNRTTSLNDLTPEKRTEYFQELLDNKEFKHDEDFY